MNTGRALVLAAVLGGAVWVLALLAPPLFVGLAVTTVVAAALILIRERETPMEVPKVPAGAAASPDLGSLVDLFAEGILLLDADRTVVAVNEAAARIFGRPRAEMTGVSLIRAARDHAFVDVLREAAGQPREVVLADQRVIYATASRVSLGDLRTVLTLQDITALRRAERARQELVANVSHELRTPIAAAQALAETLESGVDEPQQRARFHHQLTAEIERLGRMVDRLLRLSRLESRVEEFALRPESVQGLLDEAIRRIYPVAERSGVELRSQVEADVSLVMVDRERVLEVLSNLTDNAIRFSPSGEAVTLIARRDGGRVRITVRDHGPGILPAERARVFERFYTGDRARSDGAGTGLGLSIARHIISRHGGEIWVGDEAPGAALCFTLPIAESEAPVEAGAEATQARSG